PTTPLCHTADLPATLSTYVSHTHPPPPLLILLFFHGSPPHRHLHSFPTRRSSDLAVDAASDHPWRQRRKTVDGSSVDGNVLNRIDRKSTRLNSSHLGISYAVFCLKKKKKKKNKKISNKI